jgi:hypothetical protein
VICSQCGTEIADKALVCYRCGHSTAEAHERATGGASGPHRSSVFSAVALLILVVAGLLMSRAAAGHVPRVVGWVLAGLGVLLLGWRILRRR